MDAFVRVIERCGYRVLKLEWMVAFVMREFHDLGRHEVEAIAASGFHALLDVHPGKILEAAVGAHPGSEVAGVAIAQRRTHRGVFECAGIHLVLRVPKGELIAGQTRFLVVRKRGKIVIHYVVLPYLPQESGASDHGDFAACPDLKFFDVLAENIGVLLEIFAQIVA